MNKLCNTCNIRKPLSDFGKATSRNNFRDRASKLKGKCKDCDADYARKWRERNRNYRGSGKLSQYPAEDKLLISAIGSRLIDAKSRAKKYNQITPTIDKHYLYLLFKEQQGLCALSGVELSLAKQTPTCLSLDKIDPSNGYVQGNVQWLCWAVNRAKGDLSTTVFQDMCKKIAVKCND